MHSDKNNTSLFLPLYLSKFGFCYRYKLSPNIFTSPNECICSKVDSSIKEVCPPVGIFNISACNDNSPLLASLPHFYGGEKSLFEMVDGLNPEEKKHESYMDVHKVLRLHEFCKL